MSEDKPWPDFVTIEALQKRIELLEEALRIRGCTESYIKEIQEVRNERSA
jgi:hypothetical protein